MVVWFVLKIDNSRHTVNTRSLLHFPQKTMPWPLLTDLAFFVEQQAGSGLAIALGIKPAYARLQASIRGWSLVTGPFSWAKIRLLPEVTLFFQIGFIPVWSLFSAGLNCLTKSDAPGLPESPNRAPCGVD
jgi:hypothetical protein